MNKCTDIVLLEQIPGVGDVLDVTINNNTHALWFFPYADSLKYLDKEVIVEYRKDIYKGELRDFIATFTIPTMVATLDKKDNFKLYLEQEDNQASLSFNEIEDGSTAYNCTVFCTAQEFKSSKNAAWMQLTIRDKSMHTAPLRIFDYENNKAELAGKYINTELTRTQWGFQSEKAVPINREILPNPEIDIAKQYILNFFANDPISYVFINKSVVLDFLSNVVDYEEGYGLVRLAMELAMVDNLNNITKDIDVVTIGQALLASRAYTCRESVLSHSVNNIVISMQYQWPKKQLLLQLLDDSLVDKPKEYYVMKSIQETVDTILQVRKGTVFGRDV